MSARLPTPEEEALRAYPDGSAEGMLLGHLRIAYRAGATERDAAILSRLHEIRRAGRYARRDGDGADMFETLITELEGGS